MNLRNLGETQSIMLTLEYQLAELPLVDPKKRSKMSSAPIESLTEFNVTKYLQNLPSRLTVGQAAHLLPQYRGGMQYASRRTTSTENEANFVKSDEEET